MGVDEFQDWQEFYRYREELAAIGPAGMRAARMDEEGETDHKGIAQGLHSMFSTMAKDFTG